MQRRWVWLSGVLFLSARAALAVPVAGLAGMVTTAHPVATAAGIEMLRAGGNAVDAAVAAAVTLAVVEPYSSGLGGGGFALVSAGGNLLFSDFREVAPSAAQAPMFIRDGKVDPLLSRDGGLAVAVPGAVAGYVQLLERLGQLPRDRVLAPALRAAQDGFTVDLAYQNHTRQRLQVLRRDAEARRIFLTQDKDGSWAVPSIGTLIVQTDLANTLRAIMKEGAGAFYQGRIAHALVTSTAAHGGILTAADLTDYKVREHAPLVGSYRGHTIVTAPPPSSGGQILLTLLNVMESLPASMPLHDLRRLHLYLEASKRAFADRALLGDPHQDAEIYAILAKLTAKERGPALAKAIGEQVTPAAQVQAGEATPLVTSPPAGLPAPDPNSHTTHLCTIDKRGNAVSLTTTINYIWGAGFVAAGTGVVMNDEMDDFATDVGVPNVYGIVGAASNRVAPHKVPLSSMTPTLVFAGPTATGPLTLIAGSPGGSRIPTTLAQIIMNSVDGGVDVQTAVTLGRVHHQHLPDKVRLEPRTLDPTTVEALGRMGYHFDQEPPWSNATAIAIDANTGVRTAAADPRGVGVAMAQ